MRRRFLTDQEREDLALPPQAPVRERAPVAVVPRYTKPATELRRGDEIMTSTGWQSVCEAAVLGLQVRVTLPGMRTVSYVATQEVQVSRATSEAYEPRRRQLRARDMLQHILRGYFPDTTDHGGALDVANNLISWLDPSEPHQIAPAVEQALEERGLPRPVARTAARRIQVAFLMAMKGH